MRFLELLLGAAAVTSVMAAPDADEASTPTSTKQKRKSKFLFAGVNESGAEFGQKSLPGRLGKDYTWPVHSAIDVRTALLTCCSGSVSMEGVFAHRVMCRP